MVFGLLPLAACIPPERSNKPIPDTFVAAADGGSKADGAAQDTAKTDGSAGADSTADTAATPDSSAGSDTAGLPTGCTVDTDCASTPAQTCRIWKCNKPTGKCTIGANAPADSACDDGDVCTTGEKCTATATCQGGVPNKCDDGNDCTDDSCNPILGECQYSNDDLNDCADADKCTVQRCKSGKCTTTNKDCDDNDPCTKESCNDKTGECNYDAYKGEVVKCDDGVGCTQNDVCVGLACAGTPKNCDDDNPCTSDACPPEGAGCLNLPLAGTGPGEKCKDGDKCIETANCNNGKCEIVAHKQCSNDGNPCKTAACDKASGQCLYGDVDADTPCKDTLRCVKAGTCQKQKCVLDTPEDCDDGNQCTTGKCTTGTGCATTPADGKTCVDGDACTSADKCNAKGECVGTAKDCDDSNECTTDTCKSIGATCEHANSKDGTACTGGTCTAGVCG